MLTPVRSSTSTRSARSILSAFEELFVPQMVYDELAAGGVPAGLGRLDFELVDVSRAADGSTLDPGEAAALALAAERSAVLLTDDLDARDAARDAGVEVHGSVGVIVSATARGRLSRADAIDTIRALQRETILFITDAVVERGIELLEEER